MIYYSNYSKHYEIIMMIITIMNSLPVMNLQSFVIFPTNRSHAYQFIQEEYFHAWGSSLAMVMVARSLPNSLPPDSHCPQAPMQLKKQNPWGLGGFSKVEML